MGFYSRKLVLLSTCTFFLPILAVAPVQAQQSAFAIANGGSTLIRFRTDNPGAATAVGDFTLFGAAINLDAIDFRPLNGQLYGYLDATDTLYTVSTGDASLTPIAFGAGASETNTFLLGMDFNPTIDRVRIVTDSTQNLVYNPNSANPPAVVTPLFYGTGDVNEVSPALVVENAYSNNIAGFFSGTTQYGIDYGLDNLVTIANNAGTLTTVGSLGVAVNDTTPYVGFDIFTGLSGENTAYAVLDTTVGTAPTLYTLNLTTGAATAIGSIGGGFQQVYSLAVSPTVAPEPGALALTLPVVTLVGMVRRRRN